jgi:LysM repeat protein
MVRGLPNLRFLGYDWGCGGTLFDPTHPILPMMYPRQPSNTKVCPGCGTRLIDTARRCLVCGHLFEAERKKRPVLPPAPLLSARQILESRPPRKNVQVTLSLPLLLGVIVLLLVMNTVAILSWQQRGVTKVKVAGDNATSTYVATTYVTPTRTITPTRTAPPPTFTIEPVIEYTVKQGDSCLAVATRFKVSLDSLVAANKKLDCGLLSLGTVLIIPKATATPSPEPAITQTPAP